MLVDLLHRPSVRPVTAGAALGARYLHASRSVLSVARGPPPPPRFLARPPTCVQAARMSTAIDPLAADIAEAKAEGGPRVRSLRAELGDAFGAALAAAFPGVGARAIVNPTTKKDAKFGDYQCNNAMAVFGAVKGTDGAPKSPRDVAAAIVAALPPSPLVDVPPTVAGPGFINVRVSRAALADRLRRLLVEGPATWAPQLPARRAVVDFSSPNVAKEMHVGHLRSTIIGDTIARTLEYCGVDVLRLNHVGDWGTQFGMLIQNIAELRDGGLDAAQDEDVADLQALYKASKKRFDDDPDFKTRAREAVTRLQGGDPQYVQAWERICAASRAEFDQIYARLGVSLVERGESYYNPALPDTVADLQAAGVAVESDGAVAVFCEGHAAPLIVRKSDGGYGYATTDLAALRQRVTDEKADWIVYVTDAGQQEHFVKVFDAARRAGWVPPRDAPGGVRVDHVGFGLVLGADGKRIRTRDEGAAVRLVELLDEAVSRCAASLRERDPDADPAFVDAAAKAMGYGAVKYADLKNNRMTNYKFSFDDMLDLKGDTAVYLLYAHARIASIVRKAGRDVAALARDGTQIELEHDDEVALALAVARLPEAVEDTLAELSPNRLCDYVYGLTDAFTTFYGSCKVVGSPQEASRLLLCEATAVALRQAMALIGLTPLYRL